MSERAELALALAAAPVACCAMVRHRPVPPTPAARRATRGGWAAGAAIAVALAIGVAWSVWHRPERSSAPPSRGADPALATLDLPAANQRAIALVEAHRFVESIPYFRREFDLIGQQAGSPRHDPLILE